MLRIGELAHHTRVSVRMLRHYDRLGLVVPEHVEPGSGYRFYAASQIGRVNALVALRELGFTLEQVGTFLADATEVGDLLELLRRRRDELEQQIATDTRRLAEVGRRLRSIERGLTMTNPTLARRPLPALRLQQLGTEVNDEVEIGGAVDALLKTFTERVAAAGGRFDGLGVRTYFGRPDGALIDLAVGLPLPDGADPLPGLEVAEVAAQPDGAVFTYRGPASELADAWSTIDVALEEQGLESFGPYRQVHLATADDRGDVLVEIQCPVRPAGPCERREPGSLTGLAAPA